MKAVRRMAVIGLWLVLVVGVNVALAVAVTRPVVFSEGWYQHKLADSVPSCVTNDIGWGDSPYMSLAWNAYGDSGAIYYVGLKWSDNSHHMDWRVDTILTCSLTAADAARTSTRRWTEQFARPLSEFGQAMFMSDTGANAAALTIWIDSVTVVADPE